MVGLSCVREFQVFHGESRLKLRVSKYTLASLATSPEKQQGSMEDSFRPQHLDRKGA